MANTRNKFTLKQRRRHRKHKNNTGKLKKIKKYYGGLITKDDFSKIIINTGRVGINDRTIAMFVNETFLRKLMENVGITNIDDNEDFKNYKKITDMYLDYLLDLCSFVEQNGSGRISHKYYDNIEYELKTLKNVQNSFSPTADSPYPEFIRVIVNVHLSGMKDERDKLLSYLENLIKQFNDIYSSLEKKYELIKDIASNRTLTFAEKKAIETTNRFHQPSEEYIAYINLIRDFIGFLKSNPLFVTFGAIEQTNGLIAINTFSECPPVGRIIKIVLTEEKKKFNAKFEELKSKYKDKNNKLQTTRDYIYDVIIKIFQDVNIVYKKNNIDNIVFSKLSNTSEEAVVMVKKDSMFYKGISKENLINFNIHNKPDGPLLFYYLGFDVITAAAYSVSNTTLDEDPRTFNAQDEFCNFSAGYVGEFKILKDLKMLDFKNKNIHSIIDSIAENSKLDDASKKEMKSLIRKILVYSKENDDMLRISNYTDDFAFMELLCEATDFDGYIYATNSKGELSKGLDPEICICKPQDKISIESKTEIKDLIINCASDLSFINPYLFHSVF